jgi:hypothetical protein
MAGLGLGLLWNFVDHSLYWVLAIIGVPVVQRLITHEPTEESGISSQAWENHTKMIINVIDLLLMRSQIIWSHFQSNKNLNKGVVSNCIRQNVYLYSRRHYFELLIIFWLTREYKSYHQFSRIYLQHECHSSIQWMSDLASQLLLHIQSVTK